MNILGVDYGQKRIGLAWVQDGLDVVLPFGVIECASQDDAIQGIVSTVSSERIDTVVVGLPLSMQGAESKNSERVRVFVDALKKALTVSVEMVDERLSSKQADAMGGDASRDEKAAMVILQSYIDQQ